MIMLTNMSLEEKITRDIKNAMLTKNNTKLQVCRSIKSAILIAKTEKGGVELNQEKEIEILQRLLKQRRESEKIYREKSRFDLANEEYEQANMILIYLPEPYTLEETEKLISVVMKDLNVNSKKDMGKLISEVIKRGKGRVSGKTASSLIQKKLN